MTARINMASKLKFTGVGLLAALIAVSVGACNSPPMGAVTGDSPSQPPSSPSEGERADLIPGLVRSLSVADERTLYEAKSRLLSICMDDAGYEYARPSWEESRAADAEVIAMSTANGDPQRAMTDLAWAESNGYGIPENPEVNFGPDQGSSEDPALLDALYGEPGVDDVELTLPDGGVLGVSTKGCNAEAEEELFGDALEWALVEHVVNNLNASFDALLKNDEMWRSVNDDWAACMADQGWPDFSEQFDAFDFALGRVIDNDPNAEDIERRVAVADAVCVERTDLVNERISIEDRLQQDFRDRPIPEVDSYIEMRASALDRAAQILRDL